MSGCVGVIDPCCTTGAYRNSSAWVNTESSRICLLAGFASAVLLRSTAMKRVRNSIDPMFHNERDLCFEVPRIEDKDL